ncbi:BatD family protein [Faecalibacter sp. LW9]|uniref:BatD family protein n=1 Tax=Faecalibacter sp. LW9 TaxID=3103144 RepID=UPI002B0003DA|nr:BatD family protein [Faecalibacter sp. LW9]
MGTSRFTHTMLLFVLTSIVTLAQNITFKAEANRKSLAVGESLQVGFFIEADAMDYSIDSPMRYPEHQGLRLVGENKTQNVQYVNGKGQIQDGIILIFNAEKEGKLRIGSARIVIDGKTYTTKPIDIEVTKSGTSTLSNRANTNQPVFLQTNVSNSNPYVNEQVNLTVKMFSRDLGLLNRKRNFRQGKLEGLSPKMVTSRPESIKQEMVSGKPYFSEEIAKYVVFPEKEGQITIDPFSVDILVSGIYGTEAYEIRSNPVTIHAKGIPMEGRPKNFAGAVGDFKLKSSINKTEINANESANLKVEISGTGNFNKIAIPEVKAPQNIETYAPKRHNNFKTYEDGMQGSVTSEVVMVPEYGGNYTISPVEFSYFDPKKEKFVTLKSEEVHLTVNGETAQELGTGNDMAFKGHNEDTSKNPLVESVAEISETVSGGNGKWLWTAGGLLFASILGLLLLRRKKEDNEDQYVEIHPEMDDKQRFAPKAVSSPIVEVQPTTIQVSEESKRVLKQKLDKLQENIHHPDFKTFFQLQEDLLCEMGMKFTGTD